jgi:uncharacterized glyoxalase superfamily protein PhnB
MADRHDDALAAVAAALEGYPNAGFRARLRRRLERSIEMKAAERTEAPAGGARPGFTAVTPYLMAQNIDPVIAFVTRTFGAEELQRSTGSAGGIHCELRIGESMVMCGGGTSGRTIDVAPRLMGLHVRVDDVDTVYRRAIEAGGTSLGPPADRPYGERSGYVKDPAGNQWYIATPLAPAGGANGPLTVTPHLYVQRTVERGAPEFIAFLQAAFGAEPEMRHDGPDGLVAHAVVRLRGSAIALGEGREPGFAAPAAFYLYVDDCDALYARALEAGGRVVYPIADQPYGDRMGGITDPWGNEWFIATHLATR